MEVRVGYKQTEVGLIPEDWIVSPLGSIGNFKNGINKGSEAFGHGSPFVNLMDVFGVSKIVSSDSLDLVETTSSEQQSYDLRKGDVIFIRSSVKPSGVGLTAVVESDLPKTVYSGFLIRFRDGGILDNIFKRHCFYQDGFRKRIIEASSVSANTNINQDNLKRLLIAIPPTKTEQEAIAEALSDADALIESLEQLVAKKRQIKQGAMQELLTGKRRLPGFSSEWAVARLGDLVTTIPSGIYGTERATNGSIAMPVATTAHISDDDKWNGKLMQARFFCSEQVSSYSVRSGDLVVVKSSGSAERIKSGKIGLITKENAGKFIFSNFLMVLRPRVVSSEFLYFYLTSHNVKKLLPSLVEASTYPNIRINEYLLIDVPLPDKVEQAAISAVLSDMGKEISALEDKLENVRQIKQGMMQELLTGRIRLV